MIVEKNGFVVIYTKKGDVSLYDFTGQCIFKGHNKEIDETKALQMLDSFAKKGIIAVC